MKIPVEAWVQRYMGTRADAGHPRGFHLRRSRCVG